MNSVEKIQQLQEEIRLEEMKIRNCKHDFGNPYSDPEIKQEPTGYKLVGYGSDVYHEATGYYEKRIPRWSRKCKICGKLEHTYEQKAIQFEPNFSK